MKIFNQHLKMINEPGGLGTSEFVPKFCALAFSSVEVKSKMLVKFELVLISIKLKAAKFCKQFGELSQLCQGVPKMQP